MDFPNETPRSIWIYSDGSAVATEMRSGSFAAVIIDAATQEKDLVFGACTSTTINRMELQAIIAAMQSLILKHGKFPNLSLNIVSDSLITVEIATGKNSPKENLDMWAQFFEIAKNFVSLTIMHEKRNVHPAQVTVDAVCDHLRRWIADTFFLIRNHPLFNTFNINRKSLNEIRGRNSDSDK